LTQFDACRDAWDHLVAAGAYPPFMKAEFVAAALAEFGTGRERVALYQADAGALAVGILAPESRGRWQTFQPSQLPLGAFVHDRSLQVETLVRELLPSLPGVALMAALSQQDPAVVGRPPHSACLCTLDYVQTARVVVEAPFDDYWAARGKNLRTNVKRQLAKLRDSNVELRYEIVDTPNRMAEAIADYGRLESSGWKVGAGTAVAADNPQGRFYRTVFERLSGEGKARIYRLLVDGRLAAADLCIEDDGVAVILKTAYDEASGSLSPATLLRHHYFRSLFDERRVARIEFFGKVMEWHRRWTNDVRMLYHVNVYRAPLLRRIHDRLRRDRAAPPEGKTVPA
jgi:CelD/BcsL family acetyltransferase involved in cellulose biosynthesis